MTPTSAAPARAPESGHGLDGAQPVQPLRPIDSVYDEVAKPRICDNQTRDTIRANSRTVALCPTWQFFFLICCISRGSNTTDDQQSQKQQRKLERMPVRVTKKTKS
jgi:hypothetical protein